MTTKFKLMLPYVLVLAACGKSTRSNPEIPVAPSHVPADISDCAPDCAPGSARKPVPALPPTPTPTLAPTLPPEASPTLPYLPPPEYTVTPEAPVNPQVPLLTLTLGVDGLPTRTVTCVILVECINNLLAEEPQ